ncbi:MAG: hypothetical protein KGI54_14570 [Pseudomonadota bacterium]|nr:hypothetical protein [Pseudomonadota bacterium]
MTNTNNRRTSLAFTYKPESPPAPRVTLFDVLRVSLVIFATVCMFMAMIFTVLIVFT